jgi:hypothetical protein
MLCEEIERQLRGIGTQITVFTHLEPFEDSASWEDQALDRVEAPTSAP